MFDVTMGSFDGAETCTLVGTCLLSLLTSKLNCDIGLYRDDGLAACEAPPRTIEKIKKQICAIFKSQNLKITIDANKKVVDFLDITFNIENNTYKPYTKPSNKIMYINSKSNHPPCIIKNLPESINRRLNTISSNKDMFDQSVRPYQEALNNSGYNHKLIYKPIHSNTSRNRTRNITWYNPPYSSNVKTNIGKQFLNTIDKCFHANHPLKKLFSRQTLKVSYSCMPNIKSAIDAHNNKLIKGSANNIATTNRTCNCRNKPECPLDGNCLARCIVYQATVTRLDNSTDETYVGLCETDFKARFSNHKSSFKHSDKRHSTELSKYIWQLKDNNINFKTKWNLLKTCRSYSNTTKRCNLCLMEKFIIICKPELCSLNKRNELASTCRHARNYLLSHISAKSTRHMTSQIT